MGMIGKKTRALPTQRTSQSPRAVKPRFHLSFAQGRFLSSPKDSQNHPKSWVQNPPNQKFHWIGFLTRNHGCFNVFHMKHWVSCNISPKPIDWRFPTHPDPGTAALWENHFGLVSGGCRLSSAAFFFNQAPCGEAFGCPKKVGILWDTLNSS